MRADGGGRRARCPSAVHPGNERRPRLGGLQKRGAEAVIIVKWNNLRGRRAARRRGGDPGAAGARAWIARGGPEAGPGRGERRRAPRAQRPSAAPRAPRGPAAAQRAGRGGRRRLGAPYTSKGLSEPVRVPRAEMRAWTCALSAWVRRIASSAGEAPWVSPVKISPAALLPW